MDAVSEAGSLGISASHSHTYTASAQGTSSVYYATCDALTSLRTMDAKAYCDVTERECAVATSLSYIDKVSSNAEAITTVDDRIVTLEGIIDSLSDDSAIATHISANNSAFYHISDDDVAGVFANVYCDKIGN